MSSGRGDFRDQSLGPQGEVPFQMRNTGTYIEGALFLAGNKVCYPGEWGSLGRGFHTEKFHYRWNN